MKFSEHPPTRYSIYRHRLRSPLQDENQESDIYLVLVAWASLVQFHQRVASHMHLHITTWCTDGRFLNKPQHRVTCSVRNERSLVKDCSKDVLEED